MFTRLKKCCLKNLWGGVINGYAFTYYGWESQSNDREETYPLLDKYFKNGEYLDCVVIQLGENVTDAGNENSTYEKDYKKLIEHIKKEAPNAKIVTIGDFWADATKDAVKSKVADQENVAYVDLSEIQGDPDYEAGMGTMVEGDDGQKHKIEYSGVATHPGDKGMKYIANKVVEAIEE